MKNIRFSIHRHTPLLSLALCAGMTAASYGADWPAFRGPAGTGIADEADVPLHWSNDEHVKWKAPLPGPGDSSPVVSGTRVFVACATASGKRRGLYCFDRSWSTPVVKQIDGRDQVVVSLPHRVQAYDPDNGHLLWSCGGLGDLVYTSVVVGDGVGAALGGFHGPAIGFKLGGSGDVTEQNRLWRVADKNPQRIGSGVILGDHLYVIDEPGQLECIDMQTGQAAWRGRLGGDKVWASLVAAAGRLYVTSQAGTTYVVAADPRDFKLLAKNELGEPSNSTLAISGGQIFLRTFEHLVCIE